MMSKIKSLFETHKEGILYLFFGVLTTLVNFIAFYLFSLLLSDELYLVTNVIAWVIAVIFAFITNKLFVFRSGSFRLSVLIRQIPEFIGARAASLAIEEIGLWLLVDILGMKGIGAELLSIHISGELIAKVILAVIVVILNYFFSKFIIFKKGSGGTEQ